MSASSAARGAASTPLACGPRCASLQATRREMLRCTREWADERRRAAERGLHRGGRRLGRLRRRGAAVGGPVRPRRAARGRLARPEPLAACADRLCQDHVPPDAVLEPGDGAGAGAGRPPRPLAARPHPRRLLGDQRAALCPRPACGLRPLAPARLHRLVLRGRAALFPPLRGPGARRLRPAWQGRAARRLRPARPQPAGARLHRRRGRARLPPQRRLQRRRPGRRRLLPGDGAQRLALQQRDGLPEARTQPAEPDRRHRCAQQRPGDGRPPRRRRVLHPPRREADHQGGARGDPLGRRHRLTASAAAVRHRPGGAPAGRSACLSCTTWRRSAATCRTISRRGWPSG